MFKRLIKSIAYTNHRGLSNIRTIEFLVFLSPIGFLVVKGWTNTVAFILFFYSAFKILCNPENFFKNRSRQFWLFFCSLIAPFLCELLAQVGRSEITLRALDAPSRFLIAAIAFVYLSRHENLPKLIEKLVIGLSLGTLVSVVAVLLSEDYYWNGRAATYFVDPITFAVFLTIIATGVFFNRQKPNNKWIYSTIIFLVIFLFVYVLIQTKSRTGWVSCIFTLLFYVIFLQQTELQKKVRQLICMFIALLVIYHCSSSIQVRSRATIDNITQTIFENYKNNSVGIRFRLLQLDWTLMEMYPLFGIVDGQLPPIDIIRAENKYITPPIYKMKMLAGSHTEYSAQLVRKGIIFGSLTVFCMTLLPMIIFYQLWRSDRFARRWAPLPLLMSISLAVSALGIQVFNLKMTSTFWGLILAIFYAYCANGDRTGTKHQGS